MSSQSRFDDSKPATWMLREARYPGTCLTCNEPVKEGDQVYMKPELQDDGRKLWLVSHSHHGEPK